MMNNCNGLYPFERDLSSVILEPLKPSQIYLGNSQISPLPKMEESHQKVLKIIENFIKSFDEKN